ncbi:methionine synthase [Oxobacter pfennigii]|uniref:Methionine synthase n=1 Tax=Oxobacter pfennigii TaxID=36849 RepID=A0A0P8W782_9CLOT|nr:corrinoid protein [Oxobacter pfennigii]KPU44527.1 methionine synthase [Oxobacter pfennigii]
MEILKAISENLQSGSAPKVRELTMEALNLGIDARDVLSALMEGMGVIGVKFKNNEVYVPEVLLVARAMHAGLDILKPVLSETGAKPIGKALIGTVAGDLHDIGKNMVKYMMVGTGIDVIDIGIDVPPEEFVNAVKEHKPDIVCMSALLTTTLPAVRKSIEALEKAGLRSEIIIMIGGAPVTAAFAKEVGADMYAPDSASAAEKAREAILNKK